MPALDVYCFLTLFQTVMPNLEHTREHRYMRIGDDVERVYVLRPSYPRLMS